MVKFKPITQEQYRILVQAELAAAAALADPSDTTAEDARPVVAPIGGSPGGNGSPARSRVRIALQELDDDRK